MSKSTVSRRKFKSELSEILHIITHALYSHTEVFLRELISNASDAIDKVRYQGLQDEAVLEGDTAWKIKLAVDREAGTLTVSDNGVGMDREAIVENLGTIAKSGTKAFVERLQAADAQRVPELIGQFGVGFYAAFMVADRVTVRSRPAGDPAGGVAWASDGLGEYTLRDAEKPTRGTDVTLHLKAEAQEYLEPAKLRQVVKAYSDFIEYPVVLDVPVKDGGVEGVVEETLNSQVALWLRDKHEIEPDEYHNFYRQIANDFQDPIRVIHYVGEGTISFNALLYLPARKPLELVFGEPTYGPRLYIKRVLIQDHCEELLPPYLRFVKGVVDCPDLPLNVSREMLQHNPLLVKIRKNLAKAVLKALAELMRERPEDYAAFFGELGDVLKEGLAQDAEQREAVADLLLFDSLNTERGARTTLAEYVENMPEGQAAIYTLCGDRRESLAHSPALEVFKDRGWDVLLLTDPVDEFVLPHLPAYREKPLKAADKGELTGTIAVDDAQLKRAFIPLFETLRKLLPEVKAVRLSTRLKDSPACLVGEEGAIGAHMERLLQRLGRAEEIPEPVRILELNPEHPVVRALKQIHGHNPDDPKVEDYGKILYGQALIAAGEPLEDPADFTRRLGALLLRDTITG